MGLVSVFFGLLRRGQTPTIYGDGSTIKDFFYVTDAASAAIAVLESTEHKVFNVGSGTGTSIRQLLELMADVSGQPIQPRFAPSLPGDEKAYALDTRRIREAVGWFPQVNLKEGLRRTWDWIQSLPA
jgi:UDP-glucose 4-epimerase